MKGRKKKTGNGKRDDPFVAVLSLLCSCRLLFFSPLVVINQIVAGLSAALLLASVSLGGSIGAAISPGPGPNLCRGFCRSRSRRSRSTGTITRISSIKSIMIADGGGVIGRSPFLLLSPQPFLGLQMRDVALGDAGGYAR